MIEELCGVINCKNNAGGKVWQVPICDFHWNECCARDNGCSISWLRRNVRNDYKTLFDQYSMQTDKLSRLAMKLEMAATSLNNKARHTVPYTDENLGEHSKVIEEALHRIAKIDKWVNELATKIELSIREIDKDLDAEFHRVARREAMRRQSENLHPAYAPREKKESKPRMPKQPSKPAFNLAAALAKKKQA